MSRFNSLALLLVVAAAASLVSARFCPLEKNGDQCKSKPNHFKCAVFLKDLAGSVNGKHSWLGAVPDILKKTSVKTSDLLKKSLGGIEEEQFDLSSSTTPQCTAEVANARCAAYMFKAHNTPLDSCAVNVFNEKGLRTIGDAICAKANKFAKGINQQDVVLQFRYSGCGEGWKDVQFNATHTLTTTEKLCCDIDANGKSSFRRCNGQPFKTKCTQQDIADRQG